MVQSPTRHHTSRTALTAVGKVRQDVVRRDILRERDLAGAVNIELIDVTVERHFTKPNHGDWSVEDMRGWYAADDVLAGGTDRVIGPESTEWDTVERILAETGLLDAARPLQPSLSD